MTFPLGAGQIITAADLNSILPDGLSSSTYTPVLTAATTNPTLGTGAVQVGRYYRMGDLLAVALLIQFGTSGVAAGSGDYYVSLPIASAPIIFGGFRFAQGLAYDISANTYHVIEGILGNPTASQAIMIRDGGAAAVNASSPFTWAASDRLSLFGFYEYI